MLPRGEAPFPDAPGAHVVVNPCLSGGALEIFLEPLLPPALVVVVGRGPIARALAELGEPLGYLVELVDDLAGDAARCRGALAVVVATLGGDEAAAIRAALDAEMPLRRPGGQPAAGAAACSPG